MMDASAECEYRRESEDAVSDRPSPLYQCSAAELAGVLLDEVHAEVGSAVDAVVVGDIDDAEALQRVGGAARGVSVRS